MEAALNVLVVLSTSTRSSTAPPDIMTTAVDTGDTGEHDEDVDEVSPIKRQRVGGCAVGPLFQSCSYWPDSPAEAYHLFKPRRIESVSIDVGGAETPSTTTTYIETPQEAAERRILQLRAVQESIASFQDLKICSFML